MWTQVLTGLTAHYRFKTHEPTLGVAAATLAFLPLVPSFVEYRITGSSPTIQATAFSYWTVYLTLATSIILYRLSPFHPLAKYPGPTLFKITKWSFAFLGGRGDSHTYLKRLHDTYGSVVRVGPNELSITHKDAISPVLGKQGMPRGPLWDGRRFFEEETNKPYDNLIDVRDSNIHHQLRKEWNAAFSPGAIRDYQDLVEMRLAQLRDHLRKAVANRQETGTTVVDLSRWITYFSTDVMGDLAFGGSFELMRDGDTEGFRKILDEGLLPPTILQHVPWVTAAIKSIPFVKAQMEIFADYGRRNSRKRIEVPTKRKDLFHYLYEINKEKTGRTDEEQFKAIVANSLLTIVAGSDTTATTLCSTFCHLLSNRKAYDILRNELDEAFPDKTIDGWPDINTDALAKLPYLNAVINEGLRLVPAVPTTIQRAPEAGSGGKTLRLGEKEIFVPENTAVLIPLYALHRDARYFSPSPDSFIPERWLSSPSTGLDGEGDESELVYTTDREAFLPFSYGPANCVGRALAMIEMRCVVAMMMMCFDMHHVGCKDVEDGSQVLKEKVETWVGGLKDRFVFEKPDLVIEMSPRVRESF